MEKLRVALIGAGTVGGGVIDILKKDNELLKTRCGVDLKLALVCDKRFESGPSTIEGIPTTADAEEVFNNPEIDTVIELIGGIEPARTFVLKALQSGKSVVTANKALLAKHGLEIFNTAQKSGVEIGFEAAVAGALPVIKTLRRGLVANRINALFGILNGTCNFIITRMQNEQMEYETALKLAQDKGFAEADPSFDVNGNDAAQKLTILAGLAFDTAVREEDVPVEGISNIKQVDIKIATEMGWVIRLLAIARYTADGSLLLRVHPAMIDQNHILGSVVDEKNAIFFDTSNSGPALIMGLGAGSHPTAAAVISDLVAIARQKLEQPEIWIRESSSPPPLAKSNFCRYYLRIQTVDRPGVLAEIASTLAEFQISIATVNQQEGNEPVDLVITTASAEESAMENALAKIDQLPTVMSPTVRIRIEENI